MKKSFVLFAAVFLSFCLVSCNSKSKPEILGTWEANLTLKSELANNSDLEKPQGYLYTKQNITIAFAEGGVYTKKVEQSVEKVELAQSNEDTALAKEYFSQFFNKNLTFDGEYIQNKDSIFFTVQTVQDASGTVLSHAEYYVKDPSIGDSETASYYTFDGDSLVIDDVKYKKR